MLLGNNKQKKAKSQVGFSKDPMLYKEVGEVVGKYLHIDIDETYSYLGDATDIKKGIPNLGSMLKFLTSLIVVDLETKEYMVIKARANVGVGDKYKVLNSMTELMNFKKFINQNVAISVNMDSLRKTASDKEEKDEQK